MFAIQLRPPDSVTCADTVTDSGRTGPETAMLLNMSEISDTSFVSDSRSASLLKSTVRDARFFKEGNMFGEDASGSASSKKRTRIVDSVMVRFACLGKRTNGRGYSEDGSGRHRVCWLSSRQRGGACSGGARSGVSGPRIVAAHPDVHQYSAEPVSRRSCECPVSVVEPCASPIPVPHQYSSWRTSPSFRCSGSSVPHGALECAVDTRALARNARSLGALLHRAGTRTSIGEAQGSEPGIPHAGVAKISLLWHSCNSVRDAVTLGGTGSTMWAERYSPRMRLSRT